MLGVRHYKGIAIDLFHGDITEFVCDGMVNAANEALAGGGGVDGAIHQAGGPIILEECRQIGSCATGSAVKTSAGNLPAKAVIHTVGPVWRGGQENEPKLLESCYYNSLKLGHELGFRHLAFPSISTGIYSFPVQQAAELTFQAMRSFIDEFSDKTTIKRITMVLFSRDDHNCYQDQMFQEFSEEEA
ncbi:macro domain-containing protein [Pseudobacteriovorax antillogorgiicola]|uniref:O-acetyl-ADP-ribose deacetylase (Regulator of RNase III), contains Macro domain n=1 Tax=Pseudobacteriovorax antillogorgiicola TaxID=1513793 RepID=A0A1Y6CQM2_9BACT|nr:macro domain-containing protein [Pseudobacteriovorax antillogorgiicola]TCS46628.1 O-acetyl-ADP-ribose deacetylase (regulator of RNase III) [Pseudobacteriovorax antillogorgiicola]SMF66035.1 O-acetyl-ADP-ribose deacetylase (regulator of RNase III), contains Macro domain [Pseudobacteriovorax antillogorgiicola]